MAKSSDSSSYLPSFDDGQQINPFTNLTASKTPTWKRRLYVWLLGFPLFPVRVVLSVINVSTVFVLSKLATLGLTDADMDPVSGPPLAAWRRFLVAPFDALARYQLLLLGFWRIRVRGRCATRGEAPIIVGNHVSGLVEGMYCLSYGKLAERSFVSNAVLGPIMKATSAILVDRSDPGSRDVARRALLRRSLEADFPHTMVFPEGTCTNGTAVVQFKIGAFAPGVPVQPVCFRYPGREDYDVSFTYPHTSGSYLLGLFLQPANSMEVEYLPVYRPSEAEREDPALFAVGVQRVIAKALNVPTTKHAAEDVALCIAARKLHLPMEAGLVTWQALSEGLTGLRVKEAMVVLENFRSLDKEGKGRIDFETFASTIRRNAYRSRPIDSKTAVDDADVRENERVLTDEELRGIFDLLDTGSDGYINFQEYLCGVAVLNGRGDEDRAASLKWMFDSLACGQSHFTKERLAMLLHRAMPGLGSERLERICAEADADGDGQISREEFIQFAAKHREDLGLTADKLLCGLPVSMER